MAVYTHLDDPALAALWSVYDDDDPLARAEGIPHGSINTTYRLTTERGAVYYLRINEDKPTDDVVYERDLLAVLAGAVGGVVTPVIKRTVIGGSFFLVERRRGRPVWAEVFPALPGRDLGVFEVAAEHTAQVGAFLARAHARLRGFHGGRANPYGLRTVARWLATLPHDVTPRLRALVADLRRRRRLLPRGVVHGDLFVDNTKWHDGRLVAAFDWEMAGRDHMALDLAVCLHAWCWRREEARYDEARARALLAAYQRARPFHPSERRGFFVEALFAAARFTASRVRDFEVPRAGADGASRAYLDYRDFLARVDALEGMGERAFRTMVGLTS